jgi:hypothetical protein
MLATANFPSWRRRTLCSFRNTTRVHHGGSSRGFTTKVHDEGSRRRFTTEVHDGGSRRRFTTKVHDEGSRRRFTTGVQDGGSMTRVHDEGSRRRFRTEVHDGGSGRRFTTEVHDGGSRRRLTAEVSRRHDPSGGFRRRRSARTNAPRKRLTHPPAAVARMGRPYIMASTATPKLSSPGESACSASAAVEKDVECAGHSEEGASDTHRNSGKPFRHQTIVARFNEPSS